MVDSHDFRVKQFVDDIEIIFMVDFKYRLKQGDNGEEQTDHLQKDMIDGFDHSCWLHFEKLEMQTCMSPQYHLGGLSAAKKLSRCSGSGVVRKWIVWARL